MLHGIDTEPVSLTR